jgi:hypothetical protein
VCLYHRLLERQVSLPLGGAARQQGLNPRRVCRGMKIVFTRRAADGIHAAIVRFTKPPG